MLTIYNCWEFQLSLIW